MADLPCNLNLRIDPQFGQEELVFRTDLDIPQPVALTPQDNAHYCLDAQRGNNSHIALSWTASAGATLYVLQWSDSQDMQGGSLRQEILATTAYALIRNQDIRLGETIFWRVFALNTSGGISLPSQPRQLTYSCEGLTDGDPDKAADFNVEVELIGPTTIRHCEDTTYYVKLSFTNKDADEREICTFDGCEWEVDFIGSATGLGTIDGDTGNELKIYVNARLDGDVSGNLEIKATLTFTDLISNVEFTKEVKMEAIVEPFNFGCGLTCTEVCVDDNPYELTYRVGLDFDAIAGYGLEVYDPRDLDPEHPGYDPCGCPNLRLNHCQQGDNELMIGSYPGVAAEEILPSQYGYIVYGGKVYDVKNHSRCTVDVGYPVGLHVSPNCEWYFVPCTCCDPITPEPDLCDCPGPFFICIAGYVVIIPNGGIVWMEIIGHIEDLQTGQSEGCCPDGLCARHIVSVSVYCYQDEFDAWHAALNISTWCKDSFIPNTVREVTTNIDDLCDDSVSEIETNLLLYKNGEEDCSLPVVISKTLIPCESTCVDITETPDPGCCGKLLWLCTNGESVQVPVAGGAHNFDVTSCCDECTSAELRTNLICNQESLNPLSLQWSYWCDGVQIDAGAINISAFCTSNDPVVYNFDALPCFLQIQVSINNAGCDACGPTGTTIEGPPL